MSKEPVLYVTARPKRGFRRAGRHWPATETRVAAADLSPEQIKALQAEPQLLVREAEEDSDKTAPDKEPAAKKAGKAS